MRGIALLFIAYTTGIVRAADAVEMNSWDRAMNVASFFTPTNPSWFMQWRDRRLRNRFPELYALTDPFWYSTSDIFETLAHAYIRKSDLPVIVSIIDNNAQLKHVIRALIVLPILSDLGLLIGDRGTGFQFSRIGAGLARLPAHTPEALSMTFQMSVTRCEPAWESLKAIADADIVGPTALAGMVGTVGSHIGAKWLYKILGLHLADLGMDFQQP